MAVTKLLHVPGTYKELTPQDFDQELRLKYAGKIIVFFYYHLIPDVLVHSSTLVCGPTVAAINLESLTESQRENLTCGGEFVATYEDGIIVSQSSELSLAALIDYELSMSFDY